MLDSELREHCLYVHLRNENLYFVVGSTLVKAPDGTWCDSVRYVAVEGDYTEYTRSREQFCEKFKQANITYY